MNWSEFFQILADFIMKLVAFFKNSEEGKGTEEEVTKKTID